MLAAHFNVKRRLKGPALARHRLRYTDQNRTEVFLNPRRKGESVNKERESFF